MKACVVDVSCAGDGIFEFLNIIVKGINNHHNYF